MSAQEKLFLAAEKDDLSLAQSVLDDAVIDGRNEEGESALHIAAKCGSDKVAALLLSKGADIDALDNSLRTPLHWAALSQKLSMVELLNKHTPRKDVIDKDENTALMLAKKLPNDAIVRELVRGDSPNPHAERLVLRAKIKSYIEGEDVISKLSAKLPNLIKSVEGGDVQKRLNNLCSQFDQPERLLQFDILGEMIKAELKEKQEKKEKEKEKHEKQDKSAKLEKQDKSDKQLKSEKNDKTEKQEAPEKTEKEKKLEQHKSPFEKLPADLQAAFVEMDLISKPKLTKQDKAEKNEKSEKADKSEEKQITKRHAELFKKLNAIVAEIQALKNLTDSKKQPLLSRELVAALEIFEKIYINYREELCHTKGLLRSQLCQSRIRVNGGFLGNNYYYLNPAASQLCESLIIHKDLLDMHLSTKVADVKEANRTVLRLGDTFLKKEPEKDTTDKKEEERPEGTKGIEPTVDSCNSVMVGGGTAPSESLRFVKGETVVDVSASKGIKGESGDNLFYQHPEWIKYLDKFNHSAQSVLAMLILADDQKADNFIGVIIKEYNNMIIKLISIDNDRAFRDAIQVQHMVNTGKSEHFVELKSLFFTCPQADEEIDPVFRQGFIKQPPIILVLSWLRDLLRKGEPEKLNLELIQGVYERIVKIHTALKQNPNITVHELLAKVHPLLAPYYAHIRKTKRHTLDAMAAPYKRPALEQFYKDNPEALKQLSAYNPEALNLLSAYNKTDKDFRVDQQDLFIDSFARFVNQLDYATLGDIYIQGYVLDIIAADLPFIKNLIISNADALDDHRLGNLASRLPELESITLKNCSRFNGSGLSELLLIKPSIHITLEEFSQISTVNLYHLIKHAENLTLVVNGKSYHVKKQGKVQDEIGELFKVALQNEIVHLTTALLMCGVQFTTDPAILAHLRLPINKEKKEEKDEKEEDKTAVFPLHVACARGNFSLVMELLRFGVPVNSINSDRRTALDVTMALIEKSVNKPDEARYQKILLYLLEKGALGCLNPSAIMSRMRKTILSPKHIQTLSPVLRQALFVFACVNNVLTPDVNEEPTSNVNNKPISNLIKLLLPKDIDSLDLNTPIELERATFTLSPPVLLAIREHLPNLRHINITRCAGVTLEVMQVMWTMPNLSSIDMDYKQVLDCGLSTPDKIGEAASLEHFNKKINVISLNLKDCMPFGAAKPTQALLKGVGKFLAESKHCLYLDMYKCKLEASDLGENIKSVDTKEASEKKASDTAKDDCENKVPDDAKYIEKEGIAFGLRNNTSLRSIYLNNNPLGDAGVEKIINALLAHPTLHTLSLDNTKCSVKGAEAIGKLLNGSNTLEVLSMSENQLTGLGARALAEGIMSRRHASRVRNKSFHLRRLNVNKNEIDEEGILLLVIALKYHLLEFADFGFNNIGDNGAKALIQLLQSCESLHYLRADNLGTTSDSIRKELNELIKRNALLYRDAAISEQIAYAHELEQQHVPNLMPPEYLELQAVKAQLAAVHGQTRSAQSGLSVSTKISAPTPRSPMVDSRPLSSLPVVSAVQGGKKDRREDLKNKLQYLNSLGYVFAASFKNDDVIISIKQAPETKKPYEVSSFLRCLQKVHDVTGSSHFSLDNKRLKLKDLNQDELARIQSILQELRIATSTSADSKLFTAANPVQLLPPSATATPAMPSGSARIGERRALIESSGNTSSDQQSSGAAVNSQLLTREPQPPRPKAP